MLCDLRGILIDERITRRGFTSLKHIDSCGCKRSLKRAADVVVRSVTHLGGVGWALGAGVARTGNYTVLDGVRPLVPAHTLQQESKGNKKHILVQCTPCTTTILLLCE